MYDIKYSILAFLKSSKEIGNVLSFTALTPFTNVFVNVFNFSERNTPSLTSLSYTNSYLYSPTLLSASLVITSGRVYPFSDGAEKHTVGKISAFVAGFSFHISFVKSTVLSGLSKNVSIFLPNVNTNSFGFSSTGIQSPFSSRLICVKR